MHIQFVQELNFTGIAKPRDFGIRLAMPSAHNRLGDTSNYTAFRRSVGALLVDTDHEFHLTDAEWVDAYAAYVEARSQIAEQAARVLAREAELVAERERALREGGSEG